MEKICFALGVCCLISLSFGCTIDLEYGARATDKSENEMDHRKIYYSEIVVFGQIKRNVSGNYPLESKEGVYSVEFEVICTYKGGPVPKTIVIAGMGKLDSCIPFFLLTFQAWYWTISQCLNDRQMYLRRIKIFSSWVHIYSVPSGLGIFFETRFEMTHSLSTTEFVVCFKCISMVTCFRLRTSRYSGVWYCYYLLANPFSRLGYLSSAAEFVVCISMVTTVVSLSTGTMVLAYLFRVQNVLHSYGNHSSFLRKKQSHCSDFISHKTSNYCVAILLFYKTSRSKQFDIKHYILFIR